MTNAYDELYLNKIKYVLENGVKMPCRTGEDTYKVLNQSITWDLADGFPICTFRPVPFKAACVELSGFLKGITDKQWYIERGCKYWNEWANPKKAPVTDKQAQLEERDLGNIYGFQIRHFGADYINYDTDYTGKGVDQLQKVVDTLKTNPYDRRMIISMWDAGHLDSMALPPCMYLYQFSYFKDRLHLTAQMRSTDLVLGLPADIMYCAVFLHLMAKTAGMEPGTVTISMVDTHVYESHVEGIRTCFDKPQYALPKLKLKEKATVFDFDWDDAELDNYQRGERMCFKVSV